MPFDSTRTIHDRWSAHHQVAAAGAMNAAVTIGTRGTSVYDPATDETTVAWTVDYVGPARIQALTQAERRDVAGQDVVGRPYLVQLVASNVGADKVAPGMRVHVTAAANDASLVKQDLWVVDVQLGSERFTRDLVCTDNQSDAPAGP